MSLHGRSAEIKRLDRLLESRTGSEGCLLLHGPAGVGKSALLAYLSAAAQSRTMTVLAQAGVEIESMLPFAGLLRLLAPLSGLHASLAPVQREALQNAASFDDRPANVHLIGLAALNLLEEAAETRPVVVIADDAHWFDEATALVLSFIARRLSPGIVFAAAYRDDFDSAFQRSDLPELTISPLSAKWAAALLRERAPGLSDSVRRAVLREAQGNPLALIELPLGWREQQPTDDPSGFSLTTRLQRSFAARALSLPTTTQTALLIAALNDDESLGETLRATKQAHPAESAVAALEIAERAQLVHLDRRSLKFSHPLIRTAIRQAASISQHQTAHGALAQTLTDEPERAVWHTAATASAPDEALASQLESTARAARRHRGTFLALRALLLAADLSDSQERRGDRLISAAELALELGQEQEMERLVGIARTLRLCPREERRLLWLIEALAEGSGAATVESMLALAERFASDGDQKLALDALLSAAIKRQQLGGDTRQQKMIVANADRLDVERTHGKLLAVYGLGAPAVRGSQVIATASSQTPGGLALDNHDGTGGFEDMHLYGLALTTCGEFEMALGFQAAAIDGFRAQGRLGLLSRGLGSQAVTAFELGDWNLAASCAEECQQVQREATDGLRTRFAPRRRELDDGVTQSVLASIAAYRGEADLAAHLLSSAARTLTPLKASFARACLLRARVAQSLTVGSFEEAYKHAIRVINADDPAYSVELGHWRCFLMDFADAAWLSGNAAAARTWIPKLPMSNETDKTMKYVHAVLNQVDVSPDSDAEFMGASDALREQPMFIRSRVALAFGTHLRRQRRPADSRPYLRTAAEGFALIGATPWRTRATEELRASGERSRRRYASERRDELTPQELQIARYAAAGLTNRAIGARMFLSHRTVGSHLYRVFPKLGINSRADLPTALGRLDLRPRSTADLTSHQSRPESP
jgi:DNA-binding CsgD family transcriptional regulator